MGGLTHAVHWWEESQLRVLVQTSMLIQLFLLFFPRLRMLAIPGWLRFIMWLAYHGGDAVAIYGLATLFNRHKDQGDDSKLLEVLWAPVLLIHLGGSDGVTAYNIEDNELWTRHLLTAVSQVTVAVYVFCKSWPPGGDKRLLTAAILLFTVGIVKCFMKAWAFKKASIYSLVTAATEQTNNGYKLEDYVRDASRFVQQPPEDHQLMEEEDPGTQHGRKKRLFEVDPETSKLFVDLSSPYDCRIGIFKEFSSHGEQKAYDSVREGLASVFLLLYTKFRTVTADASHKYKRRQVEKFIIIALLLFEVLRTLVLPWASIPLFYKSKKEAYNGSDVHLTYIILCYTAVQEFYSFTILGVAANFKKLSHEVWPETVAQYSVTGYLVRNKKYSMMMGIVSILQCKSFLDQLWCMEPCFSSARITSLIRQYLNDGWKYKIKDTASYHCFNNHNSHRGLSMNMPFDECVLVWHLATDFCFFSSSSFPNHKCAFDKPPRYIKLMREGKSLLRQGVHILRGKVPTSTTSGPECNQESLVCKAVQCRQMSNYMVYLLFVNPEMLLPGSRRNLFNMAYDELRDILRDLDQKGNLKDKLMKEEETVMGRLIEVMQSKTGKRASQEESSNEAIVRDTVITVMQEKSEKSSQEESSMKGSNIDKYSQEESSMKGSNVDKRFIHQAWDLAERLLKMDEMERWTEIQDVWVQMLCFSACRCRGYLHAKALGKGGEFLSYVWLLLFYMGMETFSESLQRELLPSYLGEFYNCTAPPPTSEVSTSGTTASSASEVHTHAGRAAAPSTSDICMAKDDDMD